MLTSRARWAGLICLLAAVILTAPLAYHNLAEPDFWFDESGQFWLAKGLNHFSPPLSAAGSWRDVLENNRQYNLDPGGFTLLLHYWTAFGEDPGWLRALPFAFLVIAVFHFMLIAWKLSGSKVIAVLASVVALLPFPMILDYGFELRAYSMEVAGIVASLFWLIKTLEHPTRSNLAALGVTAAFFLGSRYSFVIAVVAIGVVLLFQVYRRSLKQYITRGWGFYLPVAAGMVYIWLSMLRYQDPGGVPPGHVTTLILRFQSLPEIIGRIYTNLFSFQYSSFLLFILAVPLIGVIRPDFLGPERGRYYWGVWLWALSFQGVSIVLSALGKYPWAVNSRWNLNLQSVAAVSLCLLLLLAIDYLRQLSWVIGNKRWLKVVAVGCCLALVLIGFNRQVHHSQDDTTYANLQLLGDARLSSARVFVGYYAGPSVRYLFEYGPLRHRGDIYPQAFYFEGRQEYLSQSKIDADQFDIMLLALADPEMVAKYRQRSGSRFDVFPGPPRPYLLVKEQQLGGRSGETTSEIVRP
ncbi:MAG: hypothetical protein P4N59_17150 [Negativicutes bacterium]|nr:hypothetical protein [Negativicutes bacterium]